MGIYNKYSNFNRTLDAKDNRASSRTNKSDVNNISEYSTPIEMAEYISRKLVEAIEKQLKDKKQLVQPNC